MARESEVAAIHTALGARAQGCGVLLLGDAGVGKTTLARCATQSLRVPAHWVAGTESAG